MPYLILDFARGQNLTKKVNFLLTLAETVTSIIYSAIYGSLCFILLKPKTTELPNIYLIVISLSRIIIP